MCVCLQSTEYPNQNCMWTAYAVGTKSLEFKLDTCRFSADDSLSIYNGANQDAPLLITCARLRIAHTHPLRYHADCTGQSVSSSGESLTVVWKSGPSINFTATGFYGAFLAFNSTPTTRYPMHTTMTQSRCPLHE
jgi:hypothetical protein